MSSKRDTTESTEPQGTLAEVRCESFCQGTRHVTRKSDVAHTRLS